MIKAGRPGASGNRFNIQQISYIALFVALMAVCAWISIPLVVPITLQTFAMFAAVGLLGTKRATVAVGCYLLLAAIGLPVLSNFTGGLGALLGATGGYAVGFLPAVLVSGFLMDRFGKSVPVMAGAMLVGLLLCYALGTVWFMRVYQQTKGAVAWLTALGWCVFPFIVPDCAKIALAILLSKRLAPHMHLDSAGK